MTWLLAALRTRLGQAAALLALAAAAVLALLRAGGRRERQETERRNAQDGIAAHKRMDRADTDGGDDADWLRKRGERGRGDGNP